MLRHELHHGPRIGWQVRDTKTIQEYTAVLVDDMVGALYTEKARIQRVNHAQIIVKLLAGGKPVPSRKTVWKVSDMVYSHTQTGVSGIFNSPVFDSVLIPPQQVTLGDLGNLDPDGALCYQRAEGSTRDLTPKSSLKYYTFSPPNPVKYTLISTVACIAAGDPNPERKSLGVGETVSLGSLPYDIAGETTWSTSQGILSGAMWNGQVAGSSVTLNAPDSQGTATVTAQVRKVKLTMDFGVVEPSGVDAYVNAVNHYGDGVAGAGMQLNVTLQPTTVSFSQVQVYEVGEDASSISGYFNSHPPLSHTVSNANQWHGVGCDNLIDDFDYCNYYGSSLLPPPWSTEDYSGGGFTWQIPALWRVVGDTSTHSLPWSDQVFSLDGSGTLTITKFGHSVTRTVHDAVSNK